jgi:hypothetical protein
MTPKDPGARIAGALALALAVLFVALRARTADDWDGLGFLSSIHTFDLAAFSPHPPGYPVYVALLRAAHAVTRAFSNDDTTDVIAATALSGASGAMGAFCTYLALRPRLPPFAACAAAAAAFSSSLVFRASSSVGTEGVALAFACGACAVATRSETGRGALAAGALAGLGLGVRLSWWPMFLALPFALERGRRARGIAGVALGTLAWFAPLVVVVGPSQLVALFRTQAEGHAMRWGHTALAASNASPRARAAFFARDVAVDGLGLDADLVAIVLAALVIAGLAAFVRDWASARVTPPSWLLAALALYAAFVLVLQNVEESPRHVAPFVVATTAAAALGFARQSGRARLLVVPLIALLLARAASDARARLDAPPLGVQIVALAQAVPDTAVFGGDTARFAMEAHLPSGYAETLADVDLALGAMSSMPARVLVTSEIDPVGSRVPLVHVARVCRPPRADRKHACLDVYEARFSYLRR